MNFTHLRRRWSHRLDQFRNWLTRQRQHSPRRFWSVVGLLSATLALLLFLGLYVSAIAAGWLGKLPDQADLAGIRTFNASELYTADDVLLGKYFIENRISATAEELPPELINALIATEDARFFEHRGIDLRAAMRVLFKTLLGGDAAAGGGSTLSQQLAKNIYPRRRYKLLSLPTNKIREMIIARRLETVYSKSELLHLYLNTVPFGENVFGVKVAAHRYFDSSLTELRPEESATLIGMLKATSYYNPVRFPERARDRRNVVLTQMHKYGYLDAVALDSLSNKPLNTNYIREGDHEGLAPYFREHVRLELKSALDTLRKPDGSAYNLYTDGLRIHTTIDSRIQRHAERAVQVQMRTLQQNFDRHWASGKAYGDESTLQLAVERSQRYQRLRAKGWNEEAIRAVFDEPTRMRLFSWDGDPVVKTISPLDSVKYYLALLRTGLLAMRPTDGAILAWVGGPDHHYFQYDHVLAERPVGSTFKPVVYAQAIRAGIPPCEYQPNRLVTYTEYEDWKPENANGEYGGWYSLAGGLSKSVNSVAVHLITNVGIDSVRQLATRMGWGTEIPNVPSIALGTVESNLLQATQAYATFANGGKKITPFYLSRIESRTGDTLWVRPARRSGQHETVIDPITNSIMLELLQTVVDSGTARRLRYEFGITGDLAGKTGTTQNHADGWFIGFQPNLVTGVWVGGEYPSIRFRTLSQGQGGRTALPIWGEFIRSVQRDSDFSAWRRGRFPEPPDSIKWKLDCPMYVEELPIVRQEEANPLLDALIDLFHHRTEESISVEERRRQQAERRRQRAAERKAERQRNRRKWFRNRDTQ